MAKINANYEALYILDPALGEEEITGGEVQGCGGGQRDRL